MKSKLWGVLLSAVCSATLCAQVEILPDEIRNGHLETFRKMLAKDSFLKQHLTRFKEKNETCRINAARVATDFENVKAPNPVLHYIVPAMSETQYLPDVYPFDGEPNATLKIIAAGDEYEPGSFVVYPTETLGKVQFEVYDLRSADGSVFSARNLDLKVVKVWYQNGNGWYSYFQDDGSKLCPELLLNDEDLIKVDTESQNNFARITGKNGKFYYQWITPPRAVDHRCEDTPVYWLGESFQCMKPGFQDAPSFRGATLNEGEFKQFFLTAHVLKDQKPGLYSGNIILKKQNNIVGRVPVKLRVLPFELPKPKTYNDPEKDFLVFFCEYVGIDPICKLNGKDPELARKQLLAILKNFVAHGETMPNFSDAFNLSDLAKEAGCDLSTFVTFNMSNHNAADRNFHVRRMADRHRKKFGKVEGYFGSWGDEFGLSTLRSIRPMIEAYQNAGFKYTVNSRSGYQFGGYLADLFWPPVDPDQKSADVTTRYHFQYPDGYFGWYASQHVGTENPAFNRRQYGLGAYRAGFSCHYNYAHHLDGYNDKRGDTYKSMNFVYGCADGVLSTIAWEGFREGMDDIRYATKLQQLARPLEKSPDLQARYAARKALHFLAELNTDSFDLSAARLEMIRHILTLQSYSKSTETKR